MGKKVDTKRFRYVHMHDRDNPEGWVFQNFNAQVVQHEMDHLDGKLMIDRIFKAIPIVTKKIGRNDKCPCGSGKKFKKCCGG